MVEKSEIDKIYSILKKGAQNAGCFLNPNEKFAKELIKGLLENRYRYGYMSCPCRLSSGKYEIDKDIICPCAYREPDLKEYGVCYCSLYVSKEIFEKKIKIKCIPERRSFDYISIT